MFSNCCYFSSIFTFGISSSLHFADQLNSGDCSTSFFRDPGTKKKRATLLHLLPNVPATLAFELSWPLSFVSHRYPGIVNHVELVLFSVRSVFFLSRGSRPCSTDEGSLMSIYAI
ncbi:hypothetical protein V6N13_149321 [Hibiscus sabdariffa]|uniref:Secreted protein n=2 Tax=Hibiscus sabdariffa TaxID=183260 RepID=A0ABR1Z805_9ROSI